MISGKVIVSKALVSISKRIKDNIKETLESELPEIKNDIVARTKSGRSISGGGFTPYNPRYAAHKGTSTPNLTKTGAMLGSMTVSTNNRSGGVEGKIEITGGFNQDKARWNQGGNPSIPARPFMGLSKEQREGLIRKIKNAVLKK